MRISVISLAVRENIARKPALPVVFETFKHDSISLVTLMFLIHPFAFFLLTLIYLR